MSLEPVDRLLLVQQQGDVWELFHENSKTSRHERHPTFALRPSDAAIVQVMNRLRTVKPYRDRPKVALPGEVPASTRSLDEVMLSRETARSFARDPIRLDELAKVLFMSYGITRDNAGTEFPRPFRVVPSGGALYPLELYLHASRVEGLDPGLFHYDPEDQTLDLLRPGDASDEIAGFFVQPELVLDAAVTVFVSAVFIRSTFKYGDRGYRFVLMEAGHLAQNANLAAQEMGLATANVGGYLDRDVDRYLGMDGVSESTVYVLLAGRPGRGPAGAAGLRRPEGAGDVADR